MLATAEKNINIVLIILYIDILGIIVADDIRSEKSSSGSLGLENELEFWVHFFLPVSESCDEYFLKTLL
jgi:hypothetical protein